MPATNENRMDGFGQDERDSQDDFARLRRARLAAKQTPIVLIL